MLSYCGHRLIGLHNQRLQTLVFFLGSVKVLSLVHESIEKIYVVTKHSKRNWNGERRPVFVWYKGPFLRMRSTRYQPPTAFIHILLKTAFIQILLNEFKTEFTKSKNTRVGPIVHKSISKRNQRQEDMMKLSCLFPTHWEPPLTWLNYEGEKMAALLCWLVDYPFRRGAGWFFISPPLNKMQHHHPTF